MAVMQSSPSKTISSPVSFSHYFFLIFKRDILSQKCSRCYLSGPPGSGKTVLLMLRARQFVQQGGHVVIVNMYRGAAGRAIGHYISEAVARYYIPHGVSGKKVKVLSMIMITIVIPTM